MIKQLIIIGGGYAGVRAMQRLKGVKNLEILLIDIQPYQYLQTEAYSLIANTTNITHITVDLPSLCEYNENASFIRGKVSDIDFSKKIILCENESLSYDYLIISSGNYTKFPKIVTGLQEYSIGIKSFKNAFFIRQEFAKQLYALMNRGIPANDKYFNIIIGGAGLSGVEIAAQMASKSNEFLKLNHITKYKLNIYLIASANVVLKGMDPYLQNKSLRRLEKLGVNVMLNTRISSVEKQIVHLNTGKSIEFNFMIFTGGVTTGDYIKKLKECELTKSNQIIVENTMEIKNHTQTYAIGDVACLKDKDGNQVPSTAQCAEQSAEIAATNIKLSLKNKKQKNMFLKINGVLVALGTNNAAVILFNRFKVSGYIGYLLKHLITWSYKSSLDTKANKIHKQR